MTPKSPYFREPVYALQFWPWEEYAGLREESVSGDATALEGAVVRWWLTTSQGEVSIAPGDWIVADDAGGRRVCTREQFAQHYTNIED